MAISLHLIADNSDPKRIDRAIDYLINTRQTAVNVAGGSQIDIAMNIVERIHARKPDMLIFWRVLQDTGNIFDMTGAQWWIQRIQPRLKWMQDHKVIMVVDNESSGDDNKIRDYVTNSIARMEMLHSVGLGGAFCRFATGNIQESQYTLLKPLLDKLTAKDWISPNEYSNAPGKSSAGHLERYKRIEAVTTNKLNVSIGECGILNDYKANDGYLSIPMSGRDMAAQLLGEGIWYNADTIPRFLFAIGGYDDWKTMQVGDDALEFLEDYYSKQTPSPQPIPVPPVTPPAPPTPPPEKMITLPVSIINKLRVDTQACVDVTDRMGQQAKQTGEQMVLLGQRAITASRDLSDDLSVLNSFIRDAMST